MRALPCAMNINIYSTSSAPGRDVAEDDDPQLILIDPGAAEAPFEIIRSGAWQVQAPPDGPSQVLVTGLELGY
jgi:hypothetical protein